VFYSIFMREEPRCPFRCSDSVANRLVRISIRECSEKVKRERRNLLIKPAPTHVLYGAPNRYMDLSPCTFCQLIVNRFLHKGVDKAVARSSVERLFDNASVPSLLDNAARDPFTPHRLLHYSQIEPSPRYGGVLYKTSAFHRKLAQPPDEHFPQTIRNSAREIEHAFFTPAGHNRSD
jgi:hypothetical protein